MSFDRHRVSAGPRRDGGRIGAAIAFATSLGFLCISCSFLNGADAQQCNTNSDCAGKGAGNLQCVGNVCTTLTPVAVPSAEAGTDAGAAPATPWSCVGGAAPPPPAVDASASRVRVITFDFLSTIMPETGNYAPLANTSVQLCSKRDPLCASPLSPVVLTGADGVAEFPAPITLDFYVQATSEKLATTLYFPAFPGNLPDRLERPLYIAMEPLALLSILANSFGATFDPTHATALASLYDCDFLRTHSSGIQLLEKSPADGIPIYFRDGQPSKAATATDSSAVAGILNFTPGQIVMEARFADSQVRIGEVIALGRANAITIAELIPTQN